MLLLVSLVALGCSSPTSPDPETLVGSFSLQSPAGESQLTPERMNRRSDTRFAPPAVRD